MSAYLLSLSEDVLQIHFVVYVLTHYPNPERVVHRFVEEVAEELNHIWMLLCLKELNCFFLIHL